MTGLALVAATWASESPAGATPLPAGSPTAAPAPYTLTWSAAHPSSAPPALQHAAAAYDADTASVVVFGGVTASGGISNDTWVWDGRSWVEHPASAMTQAPPARRDASMAFDPALHQLILFGGQGQGGTYLGDTWAWNGASWYELAPGPSGSPGARSSAALALGVDGNLVLFGGVSAAPVAGVNNTTTTVPAPSPSTQSSATPSPSATPSTPSAQSPATASTRSAATPSTAASPQDVSSSGAQVLGDTWQWTSKGWVPSSAPGPSARWGAAMAYDSTNRTTVLFSGDAASPGAAPQLVPGTWTWDGSHWTRQSPSASPPVRFGAVAADDPVSGGIVLTTGNSGSGLLGDGWLWDGSDWTAAQSTGASAREAAAGAFDAAASDLLVFGGAGAGGSTLGDTERVTTAHPAASQPTTVPSPQTSAPTSQPPTSPSTAPSQTSTPPTDASTTPTTGQASTTPTTRTPRTSLTPGGGTSLVPDSPSTMTLQTSQHDVRQGATVRLAGSGFAPGSPVTITFNSDPSLVERIVAGPLGDFTATLPVPSTAHPGEHHFVATGRTAGGKPATLVAAVYVLGPAGHKGNSVPVKLGMLALALLIPAGAWLGMTGAGWWRRRRATTPSSGPRSPS